MTSLLIKALPFTVEPAAAFPVISAGADYAFWLDSARAESPMSRFSYLGAVPAEAEVLRIEDACQQDDPWRILEKKLEQAPSVADHDLPVSLQQELLGGYVGYFGYEARRALGFATPYKAETPDALWMPAVCYLMIEEASGTSYLVGSADWISAMESQLANLDAPKTVELPQLFFPTPSRSDYQADVRSSLEEIYEGNSYEVCLTAETRARLPQEINSPEGIFSLYLAQRQHNAAPYAALLKCKDHWVLSSSPERFLTLSDVGRAETKPIKGTVPRSSDPQEDARRASWLAADSKTRAENLMIVDLLRNDLSMVSQPGSVSVPVLMGVESYSTVHQLVSTVSSQLKPGVSAVQAAAACFPGGSMTGAPKPSTMSIIDRLEGRARGVYSGALGFFSASGSANLSIVIRTLVVLPNGEISLSAGGAIVADSDPAAEYEEMLTKLAAAVPH